MVFMIEEVGAELLFAAVAPAASLAHFLVSLKANNDNEDDENVPLLGIKSTTCVKETQTSNSAECL